MPDLSITFIQNNLVWEDTAKNLLSFSKLMKRIDEPTDLIILPEMFNTGFSVNPLKIAEKPVGKVFRWLQKTAVEYNCVIAGSVLTAVQGRYFNRLYWMMPDGKFKIYDKKNLFSPGDEGQYLSQGTERLIVDLKGWRVMPLICYDLRFPVWSKNRYQDGQYEYDLLIYVANWPVARKYAWKHLLVARAIENQSYVAGVNRVGQDGRGVNHSGNSMVLDAKGQIIAQADAFREQVVTTHISYEELYNFRKDFFIGPDWDRFQIDE